MCTTRILASSKKGIINQCTECKSFRIAFGTALMNFRALDYQKFCDQVNDEVQHINLSMNATIKCILIEMEFQPEFSLVLNTNELKQLNDLVQTANIILSAYNIIKDDNH